MGPTWNENVIVIPHFTACDPRLPKYERVSMSVSNLWMQISANFSPLASSIGGLILGLTSASFMRLNGQIAGISGILKGASEIPRPSTWRLAFTSGIISSGVALSIFAPGVFGNIADLVLRSSPLTFGIAGLLVGFGSQMGSGCTSGHGICGLSRLSPRSIVAVGSFMVTGITTAVLRNLWFSPTDALDVASSTWPVSNELNPTIGIGMVSIAALLVTRFALSKLEPIATFPYTLSAYIHGAFFGLGLGVSGMTDANKVTEFLGMGSSGVWDPSLVFVLFSASVVYFIHHFQMLRSKWTAPILSSQLLIPSRKDLTPSLIIGSGIFGIGWGLVGLCPGPGLVGAGAGIPSALIWSFAAIAGIKLYHNLPKLKNQ